MLYQIVLNIFTKFNTFSDNNYLQGVHTVTIFVQSVHQIHFRKVFLKKFKSKIENSKLYVKFFLSETRVFTF